MNTRIVIYNNREYPVLKEFLSGNGTYDLKMLMLADSFGEIFVVPELDVTEKWREKTA
jgi:hypothetical protein